MGLDEHKAKKKERKKERKKKEKKVRNHKEIKD